MPSTLVPRRKSVTVLAAAYGAVLRLRTYSVVAVGLARLVWAEIAAIDERGAASSARNILRRKIAMSGFFDRLFGSGDSSASRHVSTFQELRQQALQLLKQDRYEEAEKLLDENVYADNMESCFGKVVAFTLGYKFSLGGGIANAATRTRNDRGAGDAEYVDLVIFLQRYCSNLDAA